MSLASRVMVRIVADSGDIILSWALWRTPIWFLCRETADHSVQAIVNPSRSMPIGKGPGCKLAAIVPSDCLLQPRLLAFRCCSFPFHVFTIPFFITIGCDFNHNRQKNRARLRFAPTSPNNGNQSAMYFENAVIDRGGIKRDTHAGCRKKKFGSTAGGMDQTERHLFRHWRQTTRN